MAEYITLPLSEIDVDFAIQPRVNGLNQDHVDELEQAYRDGETPIEPPVVWLLNDGEYKLSQGFHRFEAMKRAGITEAKFKFYCGTFRACAMDAACSNQNHGLKRTNADKRRCVEMMLKYAENQSDRAIAIMAGVHHELVARCRSESNASTNTLAENASVSGRASDKQLETVASVPEQTSEQKRTGKDGVERKLPVKKQEAAPAIKAKPESTSQQERKPEPVNQPNQDDADNGTDVQDAENEFYRHIESVCREIDRLKHTVESWQGNPQAYTVHFPTIVGGLKRLREDLWSSRTAFQCPYCAVKGANPECNACKGTQRVCKVTHKSGTASMNRYGGVA